MPQMYGHSQRLFDLATAARDRVRESLVGRSGASNPEASTAIIMAVVAAEGFINELAEAASMIAGCGLHDAAANNTLTSLSRLLRLVEDEHAGLLLKYQLAGQILSGRTFDPGCNPFQDFASLVKLRNLLVHFGPNDDFQQDAEGRTTGNKHPKVVVGLQQRSLAVRPQPGTIVSWFDTLGTAEVAAWACETALKMILAVVDLTPPIFAKFSLNMWAARACQTAAHVLPPAAKCASFRP